MKKIIAFMVSAFLVLTLNGFAYFQQQVNYNIKVKLDDKAHILRASETIEYTNNSNKELSFIWFHLWPNAYKNNQTALAKQLVKNGQTNFYFSKEDDRGYIDSLDFKVNGKKINWEFHPEHLDIAKLNLSKPLKPGEKIIISTPFKVKIPKGIYSRLGHIGQQYQITQWYPKPAVFDKKGWHEMPYLNQGEFFSEFGSFEVKITLPENYRVGATGDLQEASEIFWLDSLARRTKYIKEFSDSNKFPPSSNTHKTLTFKQQNVHDFAWFADKRYHVLKGEVKLPNSNREVTTWVMFTNRYADLWKDAIPYVNDAIYYYSKWNGEYPYNHCTAVDGALSAGGGMEYPNITVIGGIGNAKSLENVIMHEVGHNWFYGILGSNERDFPWMDEGLNTFNEIRYMNMKFPSDSNSNPVFSFIGFDHKDHFDQNLLGYSFAARINRDQPIHTSSEDMRSINYGLITYFKSGAVFTYLRNLYGDERMDEAMQQYYEQWKFKHPYPEDLKTSLEESLGESLDWFFEGLIHSTKKLDYSLCKVKKNKNGNKLLVKNKGGIEAPFHIKTTGDSSLQVEKGFLGKKWIDAPIAESYKIGSRFLPDVYPKNNSLYFQKPFKLKFLSGIESESENQLFWTPTIGWNNYNKTILGLAIHNIGIPHKKFEYLLMPMRSLSGRNQTALNEWLLGQGELNYRIFPHTKFRQILLRTSYSGYALPSFGIVNNAGFLNWENSIRFEIEPKVPNGNNSSGFEFIANYIEELYVLEPNVPPNLTFSPSNENFFLRGIFFFDVDKTINRVTSKTGFELHEDFLKLSTDISLSHRYHRRGTVNLRFFAGAFAYNNSNIPRYNWRMDGRAGLQDYLYNEVFPDRGGIDPIFSQQFITSEGGFKVPTAVGQSNNWLSSINLKVKAPIKIPIGVYADAGVFPNSIASTTDFLYNAGLYLPILGDFFTVYMPLTYSTEIDNYLKINNIGFGETIRFNLKIKSLNPVKLRETIDIG